MRSHVAQLVSVMINYLNRNGEYKFSRQHLNACLCHSEAR